MANDGHRRQRRSIRLKDYDYHMPGAYFVTICVQGGQCLLGEVWDGKMVLNWRGHIVAGAWLWLAEQYPFVDLDAWQVMPNHFHGIIVLTDVGVDGGVGADGGVRADGDVRAVREPPLRPGPRIQKSVGRLVGAFKTVCTGQINRMRDTEGVRFWQRDFYDRVIRNERELDAIREYIDNNPAAWEDDQLFPMAPPNRFNRLWSKGDRV